MKKLLKYYVFSQNVNLYFHHFLQSYIKKALAKFIASAFSLFGCGGMESNGENYYSCRLACVLIVYFNAIIMQFLIYVLFKKHFFF